MKGLWPAVALAVALFVSGCIVPDFSGPELFQGPALKAKATEALLSVRSYNYIDEFSMTISPLPVSGPGSGSDVSPLWFFVLAWGTIDNDAGSMMVSSQDTKADGTTEATSEVAVGDFVYTKNSCTGGWSKRRVTPEERKQFVGERDHMNNFTAQLFNISTLEWNGTTRSGDRDVHVVKVVPDMKKMLSLFSDSALFSGNIESFDATYWLEWGTLYPVNGEVIMTFKVPPNGSEPGYRVEMKMNADYSDHNRVAPVVLPKEAEGAREVPAGYEDLLKDAPYTHKTAGFSICPPKDWTEADLETLGIPGILVFFFDPERDTDGAQTFTTNMNVVLGSMPSGDFDAYVKLSKDQITQQIQGAQLISDKAVTLGSGQGYLFEYTAPQAGIKLRFLQLLAPNPADKNTIFVVTFTALDSTWSKHKDAAMASLLSFQPQTPTTKPLGPVSTVPPTTAPPTTVPPSTPPSGPSLVNLPPQQLVLTADQFPLPDYSLTDDSAIGNNGWGRTFGYTSESSEYWWVNPRVYLLDAPPKNYPSASDACAGWESGEISVVDAPVIGDHVIACKITFPKSTPQVTPVFRYSVYTRNVLIEMDAELRDTSLPDDQVLDFLAALAQYQIVAIDRASPSGPVITTTGAPKFQFTAPDELTMTAGEYFEYSFCDPKPVYNTSPCGPIPTTKNPTGGNPSYHFVLGPGTGFPPFSLRLSKDGVLKGTVSKTEAGKTHTIEVCAVDLSADAVCRKVTINVNVPPTPAPTLAPTPTPTPTPECPPESAAKLYEKTAWSGRLHLDFYSEATYDATFQFTFGTTSGSCEFVPVASGQVTDGSRTWELDTEASRIYCRYHSSPGVCQTYEFTLRFELVSGSSKVGRFEVDPLYFRVQDGVTDQVLSPTQLKGEAGGGCCYWGTFTASRS